jgi:trigger factor
VDGEEIDSVTGVSYEVGSGNMLDGLDDALVGMSAGETTEFQAPLAGGEHAGEQADVTVTVQSVKERELPELDDDFAQLASEFDTLDDLRGDLREKVQRSKGMQQGVQARDRLLDVLLEAANIPVPPALVEAEVHSHLENEDRLEDDEHRTEITERATKALQTQFLLDAIVEQQKVSVSQAELIEYLVLSAQQYGMSPDAFAKAVDEADQVQGFVAEVARRKALAVALEQATVKDASGNTVDLEALQPEATEQSEESTEGGDEAAEDAGASAETGESSEGSAEPAEGSGPTA